MNVMFHRESSRRLCKGRENLSMMMSSDRAAHADATDTDCEHTYLRASEHSFSYRCFITTTTLHGLRLLIHISANKIRPTLFSSLIYVL